MKVHRWLKVLAGIVAAVASPMASAGIIYLETFAVASLPGWTVSGLWHATTNVPHSSLLALGYVKNETFSTSTLNGNYSTGFRSAGDATSPVISLPSGGPITLTFWEINQNQGGTFFDRLRFSLLTDSGTFLLASTSPNDFPPQTMLSNLGARYSEITVDLTPFEGRDVRLQFNYDTLNGTANGFPGARIDDIKLTAQAAPVPGVLALVGLGLAALGWSRRHSQPASAAATPFVP